jgi:electron transfer flavoprotein alpha subunit
MATLQPGHFPNPNEDAYRSGDIEQVGLESVSPIGLLRWTDLEAEVNLPSIPLSKAKIVVSAGRGMGSPQGFSLAAQLAEALGGVVAGSRGAFDEGWIAEEQIVGVGGQFIAPDLYVACGLSGDVYHYFGLQEARFVVAINPDEHAPIIQRANIAVVGDALEIIPAMLDLLSS